MKIGVTGLGHVGRAIVAGLQGRAEIVTYDVAVDEDYPAASMATVDVEFICVGTPSNPDGSCDLSQVDAAIAQSTSPLRILKSTVPPGTTDLLAERHGKPVVFSPEYFGEGETSSPFWNSRDGIGFTIVAGSDDEVAQVIGILEHLEDPGHEFFACRPAEAELIKYMENCLLAVKVVFANEFYNLAQAIGADWERTRAGWLLDPRMGASHTIVYPDDRGFGGRCLPKDTAAILTFAEGIGVNLELLRAAVASNARLRSNTV